MRNRLLAAGVIFGLAGVSLLALPWTRDMMNTPAVLPQAQPRPAPPGALALDGEPILDRGEADERLQNPLPATPAVLAEGEALYRIYCAVCHGESGEGGGPVASYYRIMPDLSIPFIQSYSDGWLYSIVREGGLDMPGHAEALSPHERWAIVHFIRSLDQQ